MKKNDFRQTPKTIFVELKPVRVHKSGSNFTLSENKPIIDMSRTIISKSEYIAAYKFEIRFLLVSTFQMIQ